MATYKEIKGATVQTRDEDPSLFVGTWASGANLNTGRSGISNKGAGTSPQGIVFGGIDEPGNLTATNESWNGTAWSELADLNTARRNHGGTGTYTSAIAAAGTIATGNVAIAETWNGSSWTEVAEVYVPVPP